MRLRRVVSFAWFVPATFVVLVTSYIWRPYEIDDGLIYQRYIDNLVHGYGLVYNVGERFNGLTSPLFTWAASATALAVGDAWFATKIVYALALVGACLLGGWVFAESRGEAAFTALILALTQYFYRCVGMETSLLLLLIALSLLLARRNSDWVAPALALLIATRSEGALLAATLGIGWLVRNRRLPRPLPTAMTALLLAAPFAFNLLVFGSALPQTVAAKLGQGRSGFWGPVNMLDLELVSEWTFDSSTVAAVFLLTMAALGVFHLRRAWQAVAALVFLGLLLAFYVAVNMPNYFWYYSPFVFLLLLFAAKGTWLTLTRTISERRPATTVAGALVVVGLLLTLPKLWQFTAPEFPRAAGYTAAGRWIADHTPPGASVAAVEIGAVGWHSHRPIVDILGLTNDRNATYISRGDAFSWLLHYQPDYILRNNPAWSFEVSTAALEAAGAYRAVSGFPIEGLVLLERVADPATVARIGAENALR